MGNSDLWKYCTTKHVHEFILSFHLLGITEKTEAEQLRCLYAVGKHTERHYRRAEIKKRDGRYRQILMPDPLLKKIQRNILHCILDTIPVSEYATAYQKGSALLANVNGHVGKRRILKLDIEHFFENITDTMIYQHAFPRAYFPPAAAAFLTSLCCYEGYLPQGAPTSAAISNLVMKDFDCYMGEWCQDRAITYTRYCDDMTFSGEFDEKALQNKVRSYLEAMGFALNLRKTRLTAAHQRQQVTGIVVNKKPQTSREYRRKLRQELYYCRKFGVACHLQTRKETAADKKDLEAYLQSLMGRVDFVLQVDPGNLFFQDAKEQVLQWRKELGL